MQVNYRTTKLGKVLNSRKLLEKNYGLINAKKIMLRLTDMKSINNLQTLMTLPGRYHQLKGNRKGEFACDLEHPFRLIFKPDNNPLPVDEDDNLLLSKVTIIEIEEIVDYH